MRRADLAYHLTVLLQDANLTWGDVIEKLKRTINKHLQTSIYGAVVPIFMRLAPV